VLGYDDVSAALTEITRNHDDRHVHFPNNPFASDGLSHTRPRRVIMPTFVNRSVQRFRERAQSIVDRALDAVDTDGELRVVEQLGFPLPYHLTCEILGVPEVDNSEDLRDWTWKSLELIDAFLTPEQLQENLQASGFLAEHLREVVEWKRNNLADDVLSAVIVAAEEGEVMRTDQIVSYVHTLYLAGMHTTVNQTALSLLTFMTYRDQWDLLIRQPELLDGAVEELLRFEPTAQYMRRTGVRDYEVGGTVIPAETQVVCWIASANRDEARWGPTADQFDITRADAHQHIAFGKGPHVCVGSWLARLELQVVVGTLAKRFPRTELVAQELRWPSNVVRGPEELILRLRN
jgi:cytochrome P450